MNNSSSENLFLFENSIVDSEWFTPDLYPTYLIDPDPEALLFKPGPNFVKNSQILMLKLGLLQDFWSIVYFLSGVIIVCNRRRIGPVCSFQKGLIRSWSLQIFLIRPGQKVPDPQPGFKKDFRISKVSMITLPNVAWHKNPLVLYALFRILICWMLSGALFFVLCIQLKCRMRVFLHKYEKEEAITLPIRTSFLTERRVASVRIM